MWAQKEGRSKLLDDTNVLVSGLRSRRAASFQLLELIGTGRFGIHFSAPLALEYEDALQRQASRDPVNPAAMEAVLDYHCAVATLHEIFFLWRPSLRDPGDDHVLELAVKAACGAII